MRDYREEDHRLIWFDPQMIRQMVSSICVVCTSAGGAFILSCTILFPLYPGFADVTQTTHRLLVSVADPVAI